MLSLNGNSHDTAILRNDGAYPAGGNHNARHWASPAALKHACTLIDTLARMNLKAEAKKTYLSYLWWLLEPLIFVAVFYLIFETVLDRGRGDYLFFLMCGKVPFLWFSKSIVHSAGSILRNRELMKQISVSPALFPLVKLQECLYKQFPVFLLLMLFMFAGGYTAGWNWLWLLPVTVVMLLLIVPLALTGALLTSFIPDFRYLIPILMTMLLFGSGVFWDINDIGDPALRELLLIINPLAFLLDAYRTVLMQGAAPPAFHLFTLGIVCLLALAVIIPVFASLQSRVQARVVSR